MQITGRRDLLKGLLLAGSASQIPAMAATARGRNIEKDIVFSVSGLELKIGTSTGAWSELVDQKTDAPLMKSSPDYSTFALTVDGKESPFPNLLTSSAKYRRSGEAGPDECAILSRRASQLELPRGFQMLQAGLTIPCTLRSVVYALVQNHSSWSQT